MDPSKLFHETDISTLIARIKSHPLGLVVAVDNDGSPKAAHVPVVVEARGDEIFISFHLTRKNTACNALLGSNKCLCVFTGPNAYISPDWYGVPNQVPTWNYLSVECEGDVRELNVDELVKQLDDLSEQSERMLLPKPIWTRSKMQEGKFEAMLRAIVGFEMSVENLQGTTKLNQNKSADARKKVVVALKDNPIASAMKNLDS